MAIVSTKKARFMLFTQPGMTGFKLRKEGEEWEYETTSIPQALLYARTLANSKGRQMIIHDGRGLEIARMMV